MGLRPDESRTDLLLCMLWPRAHWQSGRGDGPSGTELGHSTATLYRYVLPREGHGPGPSQSGRGWEGGRGLLRFWLLQSRVFTCKIRPQGLNTSCRGWEGIFAFWLAKIKAFSPTFCSASPDHLAQCGCASVTPASICRTCRFDLCRCPSSGYIFVDFSSEEEVKKALKCNRDYMGKGPGQGLPPRGFRASFIHSFIHSLHKYLSQPHCVPGIALGTGNAAGTAQCQTNLRNSVLLEL